MPREPSSSFAYVLTLAVSASLGSVTGCASLEQVEAVDARLRELEAATQDDRLERMEALVQANADALEALNKQVAHVIAAAGQLEFVNRPPEGLDLQHVIRRADFFFGDTQAVTVEQTHGHWVRVRVVTEVEAEKGKTRVDSRVGWINLDAPELVYLIAERPKP